MALTPEQRNVLAHILRVAKQRGASPKEVKAAIETGLVESNLSNPAGGTSDSQGWRQERASLYKDPRNLDASINRFFSETSAVKNQYGRAGDLAAAVQRPAAQYRGRYQGRSQEAQALLGSGVAAAPSMPSAGTPATTTRTVGAVDNSAQRGALIASFLGTKGADPLQFAMGIRGLQDTPGTKITTSAPGTATSSPASADASQLVSRANAIAAKKLPYKWGGGHGGKVDPYNAQPLDCSGAVSAVLGINPKVSGQFESWGKPGDGGNTGTTIAANGQHVLMKINGHWFGTSASNPGGGAGWIPQSQINQQYLAGFTLRHA